MSPLRVSTLIALVIALAPWPGVARAERARDPGEDAEHDEHDHGGLDPNAWHALANEEVYPGNIAGALSGRPRECGSISASAGRLHR